MTDETGSPTEAGSDDTVGGPAQMVAVATGIIHPAYVFESTITRPVEFVLNGTLDCQIFIQHSTFNVFMRGDRPIDLATTLNHIGETVQAVLDSAAFCLATSFRAEILSMVVDGQKLVMKEGQWPDLLPVNEKGEPYVSTENLGSLIEAAISEPSARLALADLRNAIDSPGDTMALCYRSIESVRQWFLPQGSSTKGAHRKSWEDLKAALDVKEEEIRSIERLATSRRHGADNFVSEEERLNALRLARRILERFIAHRAAKDPG